MQIWYILVTLFQIWFLQIISCNSDKGKSYDFIWAFQSQTNCMIIWSLSVIILYYIDIGINYECFFVWFLCTSMKIFLSSFSCRLSSWWSLIDLESPDECRISWKTSHIPTFSTGWNISQFQHFWTGKISDICLLQS